MDIYAHRAGRGLGPENTLEACALSLECAVDFIDFDIAMTRDEQLVVTHDLILNPDIVRNSDGKSQELGLKVVAWGYPEQEGTDFNVVLIKKLISWGIDGIITDRPDTLTSLIQKKLE